MGRRIVERLTFRTMLVGAAAALAVLSSVATAQVPATSESSNPLDLWGYSPTADGGMARTCAEAGGERACALVFCRGDGAFWLGLEPTSAARFVDDQPGAVRFGSNARSVTWALVEGPEAGRPLWVSDLEGLETFFAGLSAAGSLRLDIGAGGGASYQFTTGNAQIALGLLRLRCQRVAAQ